MYEAGMFSINMVIRKDFVVLICLLLEHAFPFKNQHFYHYHYARHYKSATEPLWNQKTAEICFQGLLVIERVSFHEYASKEDFCWRAFLGQYDE